MNDIHFTELFDKDRSGTININEFSQLFPFINQWTQVYKRHDRNNSGTIDEPEFNAGKFLFMFYFIRMFE